MVPRMTTALRITRCPRPFDPERGAEARALLPDLSPEQGELIAGTAACSPYLAGLIAKEAAWLPQALADPAAALDGAFAGLRDDPPDAPEGPLRQVKRRVALLTGLADLSGHWTLPEVTGRLTAFADLACGVAMRAALLRELRRGKIPGMSEVDADNAGLVIMAMGKMGAGALNYSSDIDLIVLFDEQRIDPADFGEARPAYIRATRRMAATLSDITGEGYVFRTDLRLRPDPSVTPVCLGMEAAERYYESLGRTWERAAWIKARPCAGDLAGGEGFIRALRPFVWRRHLDYAAIQDAHDMRLRIRSHKGLHGPLVLEGHDMKLGAGGIRTIEFFAQFHQLVAGGRDPDLRVRGTVTALSVLADKRWIPAELAARLSDHYTAEREVEHRIQMVNDAQTHAMPGSAEGIARLAALMDRDEPDLRRELLERLSEVQELTETFFDREAGRPEGAGAVEVDPADDPALDRDLIARWHAYPALRSSRARTIFARLRPEILSRLRAAPRPAEALSAFDGFLSGLPAGVQLFSLFEANPHLVDLLVDIVATSEDLARYLSRNASVFDAVIGGGFFADWPGRDALEAELTQALAREEDYETKLDAARRWMKDWHFRIGVHHLRGLIDAGTAGGEYADLAGAILAAVFPVVADQFALRHGPPPGRGAVVLGMGSLGAGRLNARSDLDLIVIYDAAGADQSDGPRPLAARAYYARLTQALVTALSAPMAEGRLYEVDMRLRPSGNQGPVATSLGAFRDYQCGTAWVWEHLALTRARCIAHAGPKGAELSAEVGGFIADLLSQGRDRAEVLAEVATMRARIAQAKAAPHVWEPKTGPGRNQEIELIAQAGTLISGHLDGWTGRGLDNAVAEGWLTPDDRATLIEAYALCWQLGQVAKLISPRPLDPDTIGEGGLALLLRETGAADVEALTRRLRQVTDAAADAVTRVLAPYAGPDEAAKEGKDDNA